jgi:hypothetical protein
MGGASANMQKKDGLSWKQTFFSGSVKKARGFFFSVTCIVTEEKKSCQ